MERLRKILNALNSVDYLDAKNAQPEEQVPDESQEAAVMGQPLPGMEQPPPPAPGLHPQAFDAMDSTMNADLMPELPSMQAESSQTISPLNKKLKYLEMMNKKQDMNNPGFKPKKILAGGGLDNGPGIF